MRSERRGWKGLLLACVALAGLAAGARAYVNGGDFHDTRADFEKSLKAEGWGYEFGNALPFECDINVLVGRAHKAMPKKDVEHVSVEVKREIARLARDAYETARSESREVVKRGRTGSVHYQVGVYQQSTYWETNYGKKREIHAKKTRLLPFVALSVPGS